jgi:hypothetical protein
MAVVNFSIFIVLVECLAVDTFISLWQSGAFFQFVAPCAEETRFFFSTVSVLVIEFGAFETSVCNYMVIDSADLPSEFYLPMQ